MRSRSSSLIAWKMPRQPPFSTIHSAVSAAFSMVRLEPRRVVMSPRFLPASDASKWQLGRTDVLRIAAAALFADDSRSSGLDLRRASPGREALQQRLAAALERPRRQQRRLDARR